MNMLKLCQFHGIGEMLVVLIIYHFLEINIFPNIVVLVIYLYLIIIIKIKK